MTTGRINQIATVIDLVRISQRSRINSHGDTRSPRSHTIHSQDYFSNAINSQQLRLEFDRLEHRSTFKSPSHRSQSHTTHLDWLRQSLNNHVRSAISWSWQSVTPHPPLVQLSGMTPYTPNSGKYVTEQTTSTHITPNVHRVSYALTTERIQTLWSSACLSRLTPPGRPTHRGPVRSGAPRAAPLTAFHIVDKNVWQ